MGSNGILSFGTSYNPFSNSQFTSTSQNYLIAPFWDDINIVNGGTISYEIFESGYLLDQVNSFIRARRPTTFRGTWMLVAYYYEVQPYSGSGEV